MAITQSPTPKKTPNNKLQKNRKRVVASVWLIMALLSGAAALALWMFSSAPGFDKKTEETGQKTEETVANTLGQVTKIEPLNELDNEVQPISFDALVRDLRDYPPEFKDARYLKKNKGKWTVQVMDVSEHDIITDYLNSRDDREKFAYFRYRDDSNQPRYILTYDVVGSKKLAEGTADAVDFDLPSNVRLIPEQLSTYIDVIENYELSAPIKDLSSNRTRQVRLQPTKRELAVRRRNEAASQSSQSSSSSEVNDNSSNNSQRSNSPAASSSPIRNSNDTNDTLSVQEERKVIVDGEEAPLSNTGVANQSNAQGSAPQTPSRPKPDSSPKPQSAPVTPVPPTKPAPSNNRPANNSNSGGNASTDSIGQLIEEKTQ